MNRANEATPQFGDARPPILSQRINAERIVVLGWSRAILLQLAHPLVAAGVSDHSSFRAGAWPAVWRLHLTVRAMLALIFGDATRQEQTLDGIRRIHQRVHGHLSTDVGPWPAGTRYSAEDPELVCWVHATLLESLPLVYELLVEPLTTTDRDTYCVEAAPLAVALGAHDADVPRSWADTRAYLEHMYESGRIAVGPQAREIAASVLAPPFGPIGAPAVWVNRLLTVGLLPPILRHQYGLTWTAADDRSLARVVMVLRKTRAILPDLLARWPEARLRGAE